MLSWRSQNQDQISGPRAWAAARLEIQPVAWQASPGPWQELVLLVDHQRLRLHLNQKNQVWTDWPALEPGLYPLKLYRQAACLQAWQIFVSAPPLSQQQWLHLLQDLRYGLPWSLLARQQNWRSVPVKLVHSVHNHLPKNIAEEAHFWQAELSARGGLRQALNAIQRQPLSAYRQAAEATPVARIRRPSPRLLYKNVLALPAQQTLWQAQSRIDHCRPENQLILALVRSLLQRFQHLATPLPDSKDQTTSSAPAIFQSLYADLQTLWKRHRLSKLKPAPRLDLAFPILEPAYAYCQQLLAHTERFAWPDFNGNHRLAYRQFGLLYQDWCQLQLLKQILAWGESNDWRLLRLQRFPQRGQVLTLSKAELELSLWVERSFSPASTEIQSFSRKQRPDFCLFLKSTAGSRKSIQGLVFDAKFRQDQFQPHKNDLDRLHAYRDAIRWQDQPVFCEAILLYPGTEVHYSEQLSAWQSLPDGINLAWPVKQTLARLLQKSIDRV